MKWVLLVLALIVPRSAAACGGFFCGTTPVDQAGEKILFAVDELGIEVHVQIKYTGTDSEFAWVVPVQKVPTLKLGVDQVFYLVDQLTKPVFYLNWHETGMCRNPNLGGGDLDNAGGPPLPGPHSGSGVDVVAQSVVGPYDSAIIRSDDPQAIKNWLSQNGYNLTPAGAALLDPYVQEQDYFVALKLHAGSDVKDIAPIVLRFAGGEPCVPLRLTAVAAVNDMKVTAFLLGQHRAVPQNYYEVRPDLARIDWLAGGSNYESVVSAAANEASGNAFVTEYAGPSSILHGAIYVPDRFRLDYLRTLTDPAQYVSELLAEGWPRTAQMQNELRRWIPMPQSLHDMGITEQQFYNCLSCYRSALAGVAFDPVGMTNELDQRVAQPLAEAQGLFDTFPSLTRLFTMISPPEMTLDPTFTFNADLGLVSNVHQADAYLQCGLGGGYGQSPIRIVLPDGREIWLSPDGHGGYRRGNLDSLPGAESWWRLSSSGPGQKVGDNANAIGRGLRNHNDDALGGCDAAPGAAAAAGTTFGGLAIALVILLAARRRRQ
jgi:MYXO-CTERM domain-containing protein